MPKMTKETLRALKAFADQVISVGNINSQAMREYFDNASENTSLSEDARNNASEIYKIITNDKYQAFDSLTALSAKLQTMIDDPGYPDSSENAEQSTQEVITAFNDYYSNYNSLDYHIQEFNKNTGYKELNRYHSPLRTMMSVINSYSQIDSQYDLIKIQFENSNVKTYIDDLKSQDKKLSEMTDYIAFEVKDNPDFRSVDDITWNYERDTETLNAGKQELETLKSEATRLTWESIEKKNLEDAKKHQKEVVDEYKKELDKSQLEYDKARELADSAARDYNEYLKLQEDAVPKIQRAADAKRDYVNAFAKFTEMREKRVLLNHYYDITHIDKEPENDAHRLYKAYYDAKRNSDKWKKAGAMFDEFFKKYGDNDMVMAICTDPEGSTAKTFRKLYLDNPNTKAQSDMIKDSEKLFSEIKKIMPDKNFFDAMVEKAKGQNNVVDRNLLISSIRDETAKLAESSFTDLSKDKNYILYFRLNQVSKNIIEARNAEDPDKYNILEAERQKILKEMKDAAVVDLRNIDNLLELKEITAGYEEVKKNYEDASKYYQKRQTEALYAIDKLERLKVKQLEKNSAGIAKLREDVKNGNLSKMDYNKIVENTFKTKDIDAYYHEMKKNAEENLQNKANELKSRKEHYKKLKSDNKDMLLNAKECSFERYADKVIKKAVKIQEETEDLEKRSGRYKHIKDTRQQFDKVDRVRSDLYKTYKNRDVSVKISKSVDEKISVFKKNFSNARKNQHADPREANSEKYNAIMDALDEFGNKDQIQALSPDQLKEKLNKLSKAAADYKKAKLDQRFHFDIFASKKRTFRLAFADEISTFCKNEVALVGSGFDLSGEELSYINDQSRLIPEGAKNRIDHPDSHEVIQDESPKVRFRKYTERRTDEPAVEDKINSLKAIEAEYKRRLQYIDSERKTRKEIIMTDEENKRLFEEETWKSMYYLHAINELHNYKEGESMEDRWKRLNDMADETKEEKYINELKEKPEYQKYKDVVLFINNKYSDPNVQGREKIGFSTLNFYLKEHSKVTVEKNTEKEIMDKEKRRLEVIKANKEAQNQIKQPEQKNNSQQAGKGIPKPAARSAKDDDLKGPTLPKIGK